MSATHEQAANAYAAGGEPSFTAMWHACVRHTHTVVHDVPIFSDARSVRLVPPDTRRRVMLVMHGYSRETADAIVLMAVIRHRVLADRLALADRRGVRQLVILGAGLDTTAFDLPPWGEHWRVFEVDHPATQEWKRQQIAQLTWKTPANLVHAPCDFETDDIISALDRAGFDRAQPAIVSLFGVILYLTLDATTATLTQLAGLAEGSEVIISYSPPPDGTDRVAAETFAKATPTVDSTGESFIGHYRPHELEQLIRQSGFGAVTHDDVDALNARYLSGRRDRLSLHPIEQLITAHQRRS